MSKGNLYNRAINSLRVAEGWNLMACDGCRAIRDNGGVNSMDTLKALRLQPHQYRGWLEAHEAWHKARQETLPKHLTAAGVSEEFKQELFKRPQYTPHCYHLALGKFLGESRGTDAKNGVVFSNLELRQLERELLAR